MPVESAADRAVFFNKDEFGTEASYTLAAGGAAISIDGLFENEMAAKPLGEAGIISSEPMFTCRTADLPVGYGEGDSVVINAVSYKVAERPLDDATGITLMTLEKV